MLHRSFSWVLATGFLVAGIEARAAMTPHQVAQLPAPAGHTINFSNEIRPILEASCLKCHGRGKDKGGFRIDTRETFLKGGDTGPAVAEGKSAESHLIELVQGFDPDNLMPKKGSRLTATQIGVLRAWIDQGLPWDSAVNFGRLEPANLKPRRPELPRGSNAANPVDRFLDPYFASHGIKPPAPVPDRVFARRVYLDVIGMPPTPKELDGFLLDKAKDKRQKLVRELLARESDYAQHWITFWNDLLRNDYRGTGYIDGGRKQITRWLYSALVNNMPYDKFVSELINPGTNSEGFTKGIVWRGVVNASQTPAMQAAQNISQVFMGVNLKCASCHDSFINDLTLADAYGLAAIYSDDPLELVHCDKPTGKIATMQFLYPELGALPASTNKAERLHRLAEIVTQRQDARLTRTFVNRIWKRLMGRGLVEPVDDMEQKAWNPDLLDWLADDFAHNGYDVKHLLEIIMASRAYQLPVVTAPAAGAAYAFSGPAVRRLTAEQFRDSLMVLTGVGYSSPSAEINPSETDKARFTPPVSGKWLWNEPHAADKTRPGHLYFRKTFLAPPTPTEATAVVVCDDKFTLFVNGTRVGEGNDFTKSALFDLRPFLKPGENLIAIEGVNNLRDGSPPPATNIPDGNENPAGLWFYTRLRAVDRGIAVTNDFASDATWRVSEMVEADWEKSGYSATNWVEATVLGNAGIIPWRLGIGNITARLAATQFGRVRAAMVTCDPLQRALGRPNREQVVTSRPPEATTLQALELTNGETLADVLKRGAKKLLDDPDAKGKDGIVELAYERALGRKPSRTELALARELVGKPAQEGGVEDLLWSLAMLPELQLIY